METAAQFARKAVFGRHRGGPCGITAYVARVAIQAFDDDKASGSCAAVMHGGGPFVQASHKAAKGGLPKRTPITWQQRICPGRGECQSGVVVIPWTENPSRGEMHGLETPPQSPGRDADFTVRSLPIPWRPFCARPEITTSLTLSGFRRARVLWPPEAPLSTTCAVAARDQGKKPPQIE